MLFIGADPGKAGGLAMVTAQGMLVDWAKMPETSRDLIDHLKHWESRRSVEGVVRAMVERVNAGVFAGGRTMGVVSAFSFGRSVERLHTALIAAEIPFDEVSPRVWQRTMGCLTRGDKNISKARAQQLFPHVKVTHAIADALLIAEYCRRVHSGKAPPIPAGGLFDGKDEAGEEADDYEEAEAEAARQRQGRSARATETTASDVQRDGAAEVDARRERRPRLRRRA